MPTPLEIARQRLQSQEQSPIEIARQRLADQKAPPEQKAPPRTPPPSQQLFGAKGQPSALSPKIPRAKLVDDPDDQSLFSRGLENLKFGIKKGSPVASLIGATETVGGAIGKGFEVALKPAEIANNFLRRVGNSLGGAIRGTKFGGAKREAVEKGAEDLLRPGFESLKKFVEDKKRDLDIAGKIDLIKSAFSQLPPEAQKFIKEVPEIGESVLNIGLIFGGAAARGAKAKTAVEVPAVGKAGVALEESAIKAEQATRQKFVRELISPKQTAKVKEAQVARTTETGRGALKKSIIEPTPRELATEKVLSPIEGIKPTNTFQQNFNVIQSSEKTLGKELREGLKEAGGTWSKKNLKGFVNSAEVPIGVRSIEGTKQVKDIKKYVNTLSEQSTKDAFGAYDISLKFRKNINDVFGENIWTKDTPIAKYVRNVNKKLNNFVESVLPEGKLDSGMSYKEAQARRSSLIGAMENITPKAATEANTAVGRFFQRTGKALGIKSRVVQASTATLGIGAAAAFVPAVAASGGLAYGLYKAGKFIISPKVRKAVGGLLKGIDKAIPQAVTAEKAVLMELKEEAKKLMEDQETED